MVGPPPVPLGDGGPAAEVEGVQGVLRLVLPLASHPPAQPHQPLQFPAHLVQKSEPAHALLQGLIRLQTTRCMADTRPGG